MAHAALLLLVLLAVQAGALTWVDIFADPPQSPSISTGYVGQGECLDESGELLPSVTWDFATVGFELGFGVPLRLCGRAAAHASTAGPVVGFSLDRGYICYVHVTHRVEAEATSEWARVASEAIDRDPYSDGPPNAGP